MKGMNVEAPGKRRREDKEDDRDERGRGSLRC